MMLWTKFKDIVFTEQLVSTLCVVLLLKRMVPSQKYRKETKVGTCTFCTPPFNADPVDFIFHRGTI